MRATEQLSIYDTLPLRSNFFCHFSNLSGRSIIDPTKKGINRTSEGFVIKHLFTVTIEVFLPFFR
jgi:hypothetical protein